jgi:membrane-bound serine protease (ClpP class)
MKRTCRLAVRVVTGLVFVLSGPVIVFTGLAVLLAPAVSAFADQPFVDKLVLADTIQPVTAAQLDRALTKANSDGAQALLIQLDTPGGLLDSMRSMDGAILSSRVPVIV